MGSERQNTMEQSKNPSSSYYLHVEENPG